MSTAQPPETGGLSGSAAGIQQETEQVFFDALRNAVQPLEEHYREASGKLVKVQENYQQELNRRLSTAYQSYGEDVASIPAGSRRLEEATKAYTSYVEKIGDYVDPARWAASVEPIRQKLADTLKEAQGKEDAAQLTQDAVKTYYQELNGLLQNDGLAKEVARAQTRYAEGLQALLSDLEEGWQKALAALAENVKKAVAQTGDVFDLNAALKAFAGDYSALAEDLSNAYRTATDAATQHWQERAAQPPSAPAAADTSHAARAAAASAVSPFGFTADTSADTSPPAAAAPRSVGTASMPRASWVNVPEPPTESWTNDPGRESGAKPASDDDDDRGKRRASEEKKAGRSTAKPAGGRGSGKPSERKDS